MSLKPSAQKCVKNVTNDPVRNFEKWKKKYTKTKKRVKQDRQPAKKRDWQIEKDLINKLVSKYDEVGLFHSRQVEIADQSFNIECYF